METQQLVINLIDESVDITVPGARDFIGSVRISLLEVLRKQALASSFPVIDEANTQCGELRVRISISEGQTYQGGQVASIASSSKIQSEVLRKIATQFSDGEFGDLDMVFDLLFFKDNS
jgi:hypothetical protein